MERREPDYKTWVYRWAAGAGIGFCGTLLAIIFFCGKGWVESYFSGLSIQMIEMRTAINEIKENTKDIPTIRVQNGVLWKEAGH